MTGELRAERKRLVTIKSAHDKFCVFSRCDIHDARLFPESNAAYQRVDLFLCSAEMINAQTYVRPVKAMNEPVLVSHLQALGDFASHIRPRRGCQREYCRMPKILDNVFEI